MLKLTASIAFLHLIINSLGQTTNSNYLKVHSNEQIFFDYFEENILTRLKVNKVYFTGMSEGELSTFNNPEDWNNIYKSDTSFFINLDTCNGNKMLEKVTIDFKRKCKTYTKKMKNNQYVIYIFNTCVMKNNFFMTKILVSNGSRGYYYYIFLNDKFEFRLFEHSFIF